jgi:AcrR family transcriptional regulator
LDSRRERKKAQTRAALLRAAAALFSELGINATRVEDITNKIDLGKGAFYNYFESKDALVAELVAEGITVLERDYLARVGGQTDVRERVELVARLHWAFLDEYPHYAILFHQARGLLHFRETRVELLREVFSGYLHRLGAIIAPPGAGALLSREELLGVSAAVAGSIEGYRSLQAAAGLTAEPELPIVALAAGIGVLFDRRRPDSA